MGTVLINKSSGEAESLPDDLASQAAAPDGTHEVPLVDPNGEITSASLDQAHDMIASGYTQPQPEQLHSLLNHAKYSSTGQQIKAGLEGAAEAATFGASTGIERLAGVSPEDIMGRKETGYGHAIGMGVGLGATALVPVLGEANILKAAGEGVAGAVGLADVAKAGLAAKAASAAVKGATETAMLQGGDEVSRMFAGDPNQSAQTAMLDIGLSGLLGAGIGGAFGSVSPLWKATQETKVGQALAAIKNKATMADTGVVPTAAQAMMDGAGIEIPSEIRAAIGEDPIARQLFQEVREGSSKAGESARISEENLHTNSQKAIIESLGKTPADAEAAAGRSLHEEGAGMKSALTKEVKSIVDPISSVYDRVDAKTAKLPFTDLHKADLTKSLGELAKNYLENPESPDAVALNNIIRRVEPLKTIKGFQDFQSGIGSELVEKKLWHLKGMVDDAFDAVENRAVKESLGSMGADKLLTEMDMADQAYAGYRQTLNKLGDKLSLGRIRKPSDFFYKLSQLENETVQRRLTDTKDAELLGLLQKAAPETAGLVKSAHVDNLLRQAVQRAPKNQLIGTKALFSNLEKNWSPELKKFALPEGAEARLGSIQKILEAIPERINPSGTARTLDALMAKMPAGMMSMVSALMGHSPVGGFILGALGRLVGREVPDAVKLATLRYLGSGNPISGEAFKTAIELIASTIKGEHLMNAAAKNVFAAGKDVLPVAMLPHQKKLDKLDQKLKNYQMDPTPLIDVGGKTPHYLPEHGPALGLIAGNATQYLNSIRPGTEKGAPLDAPKKPSAIALSKYNRALQIAEQPLVVLRSVKDGTITSSDLMTLKTVYPNLYDRMSQKLMTNVIDITSKGQSVPYKTRLGLSLFFGEPMDSTMKPMSIMALQSSAQAATQQSQQAQAAPSKGSMKTLAKLPQQYQTSEQSREARRSAMGSA